MKKGGVAAPSLSHAITLEVELGIQPYYITPAKDITRQCILREQFIIEHVVNDETSRQVAIDIVGHVVVKPVIGWSEKRSILLRNCSRRDIDIHLRLVSMEPLKLVSKFTQSVRQVYATLNFLVARLTGIIVDISTERTAC